MYDGPRHYSYRKWEECIRCGFTYPKQEMRREYTGKKVCPDCLDQKGFKEYRAERGTNIEEITEVDSMEDLL